MEVSHSRFSFNRIAFPFLFFTRFNRDAFGCLKSNHSELRSISPWENVIGEVRIRGEVVHAVSISQLQR